MVGFPLLNGNIILIIFRPNALIAESHHRAVRDLLLSIPLADFTYDLQVNTVSAYAPAQLAVRSFEKLGRDSPMVFIYTGNMLNQAVMPGLVTLGVGKSATSHFLQAATQTSGGLGFR